MSSVFDFDLMGMNLLSLTAGVSKIFHLKIWKTGLMESHTTEERFCTFKLRPIQNMDMTGIEK